MPSLRNPLLTTAVVGAALTPVAAAEAATVLSSEPVPTRVAAWDGTVMWSQLDQATGNYRLVRSVDGGAPAPVAVPERAGGPFDIDLGTNRSGGTYAVYTRDGGYDQLRVGDTTSGSKGSRFLVKKRSILGAELAIKQVAYVEHSGGSDVVHVRNIATGHDQAIYRATSGGANFASVTRPTYDADTNAFVWARKNLGSGTGNRIVRYTLPGSKFSYAPGSPCYNATAWAGPQLGAATSSSLDGGDGVNSCDDAACTTAS
jgi:hypothetical protein